MLSLSLDDFELANKDPNYEINMRIWHTREDGHAQCEVCLAGSVLAKTFNVDRTYTADDDTLNGLLTQDIMNKLHAIDCMRKGDLLTALWNLNLNEEYEVVKEINRIAYCEDSIFNEHFTAFELILGESNDDFYYNRSCHNFKDFVTFYRGVANKLKEVEL